jgi:hypothetical protein
MGRRVTSRVRGPILLALSEESDFWIGVVAFVIMVGLFVLGVLWLIGNAVDRRKPMRNEPPTNGPIVCPMCSMAIAADVKYLGQSIACPSCHGLSTAPGATPGRSRGSIWSVGSSLWSAGSR